MLVIPPPSWITPFALKIRDMTACKWQSSMLYSESTPPMSRMSNPSIWNGDTNRWSLSFQGGRQSHSFRFLISYCPHYYQKENYHLPKLQFLRGKAINPGTTPFQGLAAQIVTKGPSVKRGKVSGTTDRNRSRRTQITAERPNKIQSR